jgi:hypothetical protein
MQRTPSQNRVREARHPAPEPDRRSRGCDREPGVNPVPVEGLASRPGGPDRPCARDTQAALPNLTVGERSPENRGAALVHRRDRSQPAFPMGRDLRRGIPAEDAWTSAPGSNPGRPGRPPTFRGGNGSHTTHPELLIRTAASERSESPRHRITPGPTKLVSLPSRGAPHHPRSSLRGVGRARRRGLSARGTSALRHPSPHGSRVLSLERLVPCRSGVTPGTAASSGGGRHRET